VATLTTPPLTASLDVARTFAVRVCRANACGSADLAATGSDPIAPSTGRGVPEVVFPAPGGDDHVLLVLWNRDGAYVVQADWMPFGSSPRASEYTDGETFRLEVTAPTTAVVAHVDRVATYSKHYPNGVVCGPECTAAQLSEPK
jgi:hypothetical protein